MNFSPANYRPGPLYQRTLTPAEVSIAEYVPPTPNKKWTPEQHQQQQAPNKEMTDSLDALHSSMIPDIDRKEALGQATLVLAEMLGCSSNGSLIVRHNSILEYTNEILGGDLAYIHSVLKYLTGRTINVSECDTIQLLEMCFLHEVCVYFLLRNLELTHNSSLTFPVINLPLKSNKLMFPQDNMQYSS